MKVWQLHLIKFNNISALLVNGLYFAWNSVCGDISEAEVHHYYEFWNVTISPTRNRNLVPFC